MSRLERLILDLEREIAYLAWVMRRQRMTDREFAIWLNGLAIASRSAEAYHKAEAERQRVERVMRGE